MNKLLIRIFLFLLFGGLSVSSASATSIRRDPKKCYSYTAEFLKSDEENFKSSPLVFIGVAEEGDRYGYPVIVKHVYKSPFSKNPERIILNKHPQPGLLDYLLFFLPSEEVSSRSSVPSEVRPYTGHEYVVFAHTIQTEVKCKWLFFDCHEEVQAKSQAAHETATGAIANARIKNPAYRILDEQPRFLGRVEKIQPLKDRDGIQELHVTFRIAEIFQDSMPLEKYLLFYRGQMPKPSHELKKCGTIVIQTHPSPCREILEVNKSYIVNVRVPERAGAEPPPKELGGEATFFTSVVGAFPVGAETALDKLSGVPRAAREADDTECIPDATTNAASNPKPFEYPKDLKGDIMMGDSGKDRYGFSPSGWEGTAAISGFNASEGDTVDVSGFLAAYHEDSAELGDFVKLEEKDGHTLIYVDRDGKSEDSGWVPVVYLLGVTEFKDATEMVRGSSLTVSANH